MTIPALTDQTVLIALGVLVPGAMLAWPKAVKWYRKKCADRKAKEKRRDASAFFEVPSFLHRYTKQSQEDGIRYRDSLYTVLDGVTFPANIDWPEMPVPQALDDFNASLPRSEPV